MSSSGLQRIPNTTTGLRRHPRLVIATVATPRTYSASRLFRPVPRLTERHQRQADLLRRIAAKDDDSWRDIEDLSSKHEELHLRMRALEDERTAQQQENRILKEAVEFLTREEQSYRARARKVSQRRVVFQTRLRPKREVRQKQSSADLITDRIITSLRDLGSRLEEIDRRLDIVSFQLNQHHESATSSIACKLKQFPRSLGRVVLRLCRRVNEVTSPAMDLPKLTKGETSAVVLGAATLFAYTHPSGLWMREMVDSLRLQGIPPTSQEFLGLLIHTASLPVIIATGPGLKKAFRRLKKSNLYKALSSLSPHRHISSSSSAQGLRKKTAYRNLINNHPDLLDKPFPMKAVLDDLRNQYVRLGPSSGRDYKVAERRLFRVQHESELGEGDPLTVRQVTQLLQPDDSVGWKTISQRLIHDRVDAIDTLSKEDRARVMFQRVYGIGATKAERFVQAGFLTLEQLREASLEKAQRVGLEHMNDIECLIPRAESERWRDILIEVFRAVDYQLGAELLGSFRRGDYFSSDLDWVLYHPDVVEMRIPRKDDPNKCKPHPKAKELMQAIFDELRRRDLLADDLLAHGPIAIKGLVRLPTPGAKARRIDLNFAPYTRRAFYTLAKTGDADLMVHLRAKAKARGWALNEYGIGPRNPNGSAWTSNLLDATEEKQIFDFLGLPYLEPEARSFSLYAKRLKIVRP